MVEAKKPGVSDRIFQEMKQMIFERKWEPGSRLPSEQAMCEIFGVSRVTVRNALLRLNALGLIETHLGDGSYVKKLDTGTRINNLIPVAYLEQDINTILEFRMEVESGACALAARKATKKDVTGLKRILKKMLALQNDLDVLALMDLEFHYSIAQISRNSLIIKTYEIVGDIYGRHMKRMVNAMGGDLGVYYHKRIVAAIEERNSAVAREVMYEHIYKNLEFANSKGVYL
ncbi:MAG: FadR family transcriptional regulator [Defluviitaleaceae bacterium]|nr:FadR family transcriptional regulator [Defluviitaleaceae bacterium]